MGLYVSCIITTLLFVAASFNVVPAQQKLTLNKITTQSETELINRKNELSKLVLTNDLKLLPGPKEYTLHFSSLPIQLPNGNILVAYCEDSVRVTISSDSGVSWSSPRAIAKTEISSYDTIWITGIKTLCGRIIVIWSGYNILQYMRMTYSDNNGATWSPVKLIGSGITATYSTKPSLSLTPDSALWISYSKYSPTMKNNLYFRKSTNNGETWSTEQAFLATSNDERDLSLVSISSNKIISVFSSDVGGNQNIYSMKSSDNGITWSASTPVVNTELDEEAPKILRLSDGTLYLIYNRKKPTRFGNSFQYDIYYVLSTDEGNTWSTPTQFTSYVGDDLNPALCVLNNKPFVTFSSKRWKEARFNYIKIWYGIIGISTDINPPPNLITWSNTPFDFGIPIWIKASIDDEIGIALVHVKYNENLVQMFDDGLHNDEAAGDFIFGASVGPFNYFGDSLRQVFGINNLKIPIDNKGVIANVAVMPVLQYSFTVVDVGAYPNTVEFDGSVAGSSAGGFFDGVGFLFSGGFLMSGLTNGSMWANGIATSSRILDYQPGPVGSSISDPKNRLYTLSSSDPPFGLKWQMWKDAVSIGANFYDGDNDGIYNPIDKNSNGQWDPNEDRPDLIGDATFWCIYNDGVPASSRRFSDVSPQGIEVRQTVFGYSSRTAPKGNIMFIRYSLINRGTVVNVLDSIFFGIWTDGDLGNYTDDLIGTDTLLNSGFYYNYGFDSKYGNDCPSFFNQLLQSALQYIPGVTFVDVNSNGQFDIGIDTPLDTAYNYMGIHRGIEKIPGARNIGLTSSSYYISSHPTYGDPSTKLDARNYLMGLNRSGSPINVCTWTFGTVLGVNCNQVNPRFLYSGNPVTNHGWICNLSTDQMGMINFGPFKLIQNKPVDIITAYIVGRGNSPLNSITEARSIAHYSKSVYDGNFSLPTSVDDGDISIPSNFMLYQNYPNPFNPSTTIKFSIPHSAFVTLKLYDILGREVITLVNEVREGGVYNSTFSTLHSTLSTGVYFYELKVGNFRDVKKMIILK